MLSSLRIIDQDEIIYDEHILLSILLKIMDSLFLSLKSFNYFLSLLVIFPEILFALEKTTKRNQFQIKTNANSFRLKLAIHFIGIMQHL